MGGSLPSAHERTGESATGRAILAAGAPTLERVSFELGGKGAHRVRRSVAGGELVSDDLVASVVHRRLSEHDWNFGFIIDGFPRNQPQAASWSTATWMR